MLILSSTTIPYSKLAPHQFQGDGVHASLKWASMVISIFWCIQGRPTEPAYIVQSGYGSNSISVQRTEEFIIRQLNRLTCFFLSTIGARRSQNNALHGTRSENKKSIALIQTVRWEM